MLFVYGATATSTYASTGWCSPSGGSPNIFTYNFGTKQISDPSQNTAGIVKAEIYIKLPILKQKQIFRLDILMEHINFIKLEIILK